MATMDRKVPQVDVRNLDRDLIEARVRDRHRSELEAWGPRRWLAERRIRREIDDEISRAESRALRRKTNTKHLF